MDDIAFHYDATKNKQGSWLDGVPLRDLTTAEYGALPAVWQQAVIQQPYYVPVKKTTKKEGE